MQYCYHDHQQQQQQFRNFRKRLSSEATVSINDDILCILQGIVCIYFTIVVCLR